MVIEQTLKNVEASEGGSVDGMAGVVGFDKLSPCFEIFFLPGSAMRQDGKAINDGRDDLVIRFILDCMRRHQIDEGGEGRRKSFW